MDGFILCLSLFLSSLNLNAETHIVGTIRTNGVSSSSYATLARISISEATSKALGEINGKVTEAALESEDGYLVYSVEILTVSSKRFEVLVDAGNGKILEVENEN
jgi:uncharacterized membrane protein YkoI